MYNVGLATVFFKDLVSASSSFEYDNSYKANTEMSLGHSFCIIANALAW